MDIELARTFLEVMAVGSFCGAAERLHISQTTVTTRLQTLEEKLECQLFTRNRNGARLTADGERFVAHATALVQIWDSAKTEMKLAQGQGSRLRVGAEISLWNPMLSNWVSWLQRNYPKITVNTDVSDANTLLAKLENGFVDAILVHRPRYLPGIMVEQLLEEKLIHVQVPNNSSPNLFVDWGTEFKAQYDATLPQPRQTAMSFNLGPLALHVMLKSGGNGYFRTRVVEEYLRSGQLERVPSSPEFSYPVYLVYKSSTTTSVLDLAFEGLREIASDYKEWQV
ncbi:HTH-type transcriptional regulator YofA [Zhongshania aliphaticivorans]|uniref:HTH-type transcriptional regulator YofA n=1 Tax=Zhongshania aliphaticivorans TaxID=1470434 RepID=A0A5S9N9Q0_9GAMM|nr:LysR family transcriptional regulator [Zhongshania aliphaticivorans]CAA0080222.1 HTH-type transcriptional regulator YofA [Zhongshania aliphaticivorans]CAA0085823.1 HTH-type transcriptional regulator YofA [Zhongshania aliphaticivorans]